MSFLIEKLENGNVQVNQNGTLVQVFPGNCDATVSLTDATYVAIAWQGKGIYSLPAKQSYIVRYGGVDYTYTFAQPVQELADLLNETVFSEYLAVDTVDASNSFTTTHQTAIVNGASTTSMYFLKGIKAIQDTKILVKSISGRIDNNRSAFIYFAKNIVLGSPATPGVINPYVTDLEGSAAIAVNTIKRSHIFYPNNSSSFNFEVNQIIDLPIGEICGVILNPIQTNVQAWADINFEQL